MDWNRMRTANKKQVNAEVYELRESRPLVFLKVILIMLLFLFIILGILYATYNLYKLPGEPQQIRVPVLNIPVSPNDTGEIRQFYPKMKFNHNQISYSIDSNCDSEKKDRMIEAFGRLEEIVPIISFYPATQNPDIEVSCTYSERHERRESYFIAGEGGAKGIIPTLRYNIITNGTILLYERPKNSLQCNWPNIELHELIHVFGFDHTSKEDSLMYPYLQDCRQGLDLEIVNMLTQLYSEENLPDLYFEDANIVKKRKYLDFNLSIKNSGSIDSPSSYLTILEDGKAIDIADLSELDALPFGAGIKLEIRNLRLESTNPSKIEFVIDYANRIKEIDEGNNRIEATLE